ncbi:hypothetical protein [Aestuariivirga sp.]|uniref:hypothetical protein n=1 Tax=Aestuariivirga sp. TaxID=2650926 RepID=UPI003593CF8F
MSRRQSKLKELLRNTSGNITLTVALAALPMLTVAGAAIDYVSMSRDITSFQSAVDTAVMAVTASDLASLTGLSGNALTQRMTQLETMASNYIEANYTSRTGRDNGFDVDLVIDGSKVQLTATHMVDSVWMKSFGIVSPEVTITSEVQKAARPIELVLVMDTTGSMGTTYMQQARVAARNLMNKIYDGPLSEKPDNEYIRVGFVPFSGAVRLDTAGYDFSMDWIDTTGAAAVSKLNFSNSNWHNWQAWTSLYNRPWNGCVEARLGDYATDDTAPIAGNTLFTPYFAPDEPSYSNSTSNGYYNSYISTSGSPNETSSITSNPGCSGFSSGSTSTTNLLCRQNNQNKYVNKSISSESSSQYGPWFNCAKTKVVGLTYDRSKVEDAITDMTASGSTVIPEGLAWGWRVLSPTAPFTQVQGSVNEPADVIAPYNSARWQKIMVLMTDGENDVLSSGNQINNLNGTWYSAYGRGKATTNNRFGTTTSSQTSAALDTKMTELCNNIKAQGITLYTVAFRVNSTSIQNRLRACATTEANYSYAADGVALAAVFDHIGENVANTNIYLSK